MNSTHSKIASRIKLERARRSWTQEKLAEVCGLSTRSIQRYEKGELPSADCILLLANTFEVDPIVFQDAVLRLNFSAPWDKPLKIVTTTVVLLFITLSIFLPEILWIFTIILILAYFLGVAGYSIREGQLLVHRAGWSKRFPLEKLEDLQVEPDAMMGSIRLFGIGGLFGYIGYFRNGLLGTYRVYATDPKKAVIARFDGKTIVITPDDPDAFVASVRAVLSDFGRKSTRQGNPPSTLTLNQ
ncbi:MAG: PH domain-containing protein [Opitutales bacterium]